MRMLNNNKDNMPFIVGGLVAGLLSVWVAGKISYPWVKKGCAVILEVDKRRGYEARIYPVEAIKVTLGTISNRINTVGKLRANESVTIRSEMAGRINYIRFKEGEDVELGQTLIEFEDSELKAELGLAKAELVLKEADFERSSKLRDRNIESVKKFDEAKAHFESAKAKVELAEAKLEKTVIKAPFSGTIGLINISAGTYMQGAQDLVTLVDNSPIKVDFKVPEKNLHDIGVGQTAEIKLDGFPNQTFTAIVDAIDSSVDALSHSISLRASVPNENGLLRAGLFANVSLIIGEKGNAMVIPDAALAREGEIEFVWLIENGKAKRRRVLTGTRESGTIEIVQGLRPDEMVITSGQINLGDGAPVEITNLKAEEEQLSSETVVSADTATLTAPVTPDAAVGTSEATVGTPEVAAITSEATVGTPEATVGTPEATVGTPEVVAITSEATVGTPEAATMEESKSIKETAVVAEKTEETTSTDSPESGNKSEEEFAAKIAPDVKESNEKQPTQIKKILGKLKNFFNA